MGKGFCEIWVALRWRTGTSDAVAQVDIGPGKEYTDTYVDGKYKGIKRGFMGEQFCNILRGVLKYEETQKGVVGAIVIVFMIIFCGVAIKNFKKVVISNRVIMCAVPIVILSFFVVYLVHGNIYKNKIEADISEQSFVTYQGSFTHDDYQKGSFYHNVHMIDENGEKVLLRLPDYGNMYGLREDYREFPVGAFEGEIIYSKRSKIVLNWTIS